MEEQYLRDIRTLMVLRLAHAISLDPAGARVEKDKIERVTVDGHAQERVRWDAAIDLALMKFHGNRANIEEILDLGWK